MNEGDNDASREQRFDDAVAEFLEAMEAGHQPDEADLVGRHPDLEESLKAFFSDYRQMGGLLGPRGPLESNSPGRTGVHDVTTAYATAAEPTPLDPAAREFGDFTLLDKIAEGGMGVVYRAKQKRLNRVVALKMIRSGRLADAEEIQRFHREAEAAAKLEHPGIVPIYQVGEANGQHYFAMAFVRGRSLAEMIREQPIPPKRAAVYVKKVALAVHYAHQRGIIHRDIKPGNVLVDEQDEPKVTDFGLAKQVDAEHSLTTSGQIIGTISYMPPEQASGTLERVASWSDVYSLGALLYALLTQRPPFQADNPLDALLKVLTDAPLAPSKSVQQHRWPWNRRTQQHASSSNSLAQSRIDRIPVELDTICLKCLEKEPHQRYATAQDLADDLERFLTGEPIVARPLSLIERSVRGCQRRPATATAILLAIVLAIGIPFFVVSQQGIQAWKRWGERAVAHSQSTTSSGLQRQLLRAARAHYSPTSNPHAAAHGLHWELAGLAMLEASTNSASYQAKLEALVAHLESLVVPGGDQADVFTSGLADAYICLGDFLVSTDEQGASGHYERAQSLLEALSAKYPANAWLRARHAAVLTDLASRAPQEELAQGLRYLQSARELAENPAPLRGLIRFDLERDDADAPEISPPSRGELAQCRRQATAEPGNPQAQFVYADALRRQGNAPESRERYQLGFQLSELGEAPVEDRRLLADHYRAAAGLSREQGNFDEAFRLNLRAITRRIAIEKAQLTDPAYVAAIRADFAELSQYCHLSLSGIEASALQQMWPTTPEAMYYAILALRRTGIPE